MSKLEERESRRRSTAVGKFVEQTPTETASSGRRGRPKEESRELKKRISLSVLPSLYKKKKKIAYIERRSVSDIVGELMKEYREEHEESICKFDTIQNLPQGQ